jgi:3-oxoacyl-(acyl-carrier-protein) synthase
MRQTGPRNEAEPDAWKLDADLFIRANPNTPCIVLSALLGAQGACVTLLGEGRDAIELALEAVAYGESDVVVAGAADSAVHTTGPKHASDEARMIVVLEEREHARRRGAPELMELEPGKELRL